MNRLKMLTMMNAANLSLHGLMDEQRHFLAPGGFAFKDGEGVEAVMAELGNIESRISKKLDKRLEDIKEGLSVPDTDKELKRLEQQHEELKAELKGARTELEAKLGRMDLGGQGGEERKTPGQQFVEAEEFKSRSGRRFNIEVEVKALTGASNSVGTLMTPQRLPMFDAPTEPHIRDLIPSGQTSSRTLQFPQRKTRSNNAAMVAEGGTKPESTFTTEMKEYVVKKIAHFVKAGTETLDDVPALRSYIDAQLLEGLLEVEDGQILKGDGTGENLLGLYTVAQAFNRAKTGDTLLDKLIRAQTQLRLVNRNASGYVLNPEDWEEVMLLKGTDGNFIWLNVLDGNGQPRLVAKPVRDTTKLAKGEWLVGDFRRGAQLFDRQQSTITVANQNEDDFIKNMVTILAEERLALVIYDTLSFVKNAPAT